MTPIGVGANRKKNRMLASTCWRQHIASYEIILCANCHRMIHKYGCPSLDEFKGKIQVDYKNFLKDK